MPNKNWKLDNPKECYGCPELRHSENSSNGGEYVYSTHDWCDLDFDIDEYNFVRPQTCVYELGA